MLKKYRFPALGIIILAYAFMQMATSKDLCDPDCQALRSIYVDLHTNNNFVYSVNRCPDYMTRDTICVYVNSSGTADWNLLAERTCMLATANGLLQQHVFVLGDYSTSTMTIDTLAEIQCP
jgi:hypothetical protein